MYLDTVTERDTHVSIVWMSSSYSRALADAVCLL